MLPTKLVVFPVLPLVQQPVLGMNVVVLVVEAEVPRIISVVAASLKLGIVLTIIHVLLLHLLYIPVLVMPVMAIHIPVMLPVLPIIPGIFPRPVLQVFAAIMIKDL